MISRADDVPYHQFVQTLNRRRGESDFLLTGGADDVIQAMWAPDTASYGYESRIASIRIIGPPGASPSATRFEIRVPGADVSLKLDARRRLNSN